MQHSRSRRLQNARRAQRNQAADESDHEAVIGVNPPHQGHGELPQAHQLLQIVSRDGDIGNLARNGRAAADGNARIRFGKGE